MTDEMKLLTALCEALGFEVKREESGVAPPAKDGTKRPVHTFSETIIISSYTLTRKPEP